MENKYVHLGQRHGRGGRRALTDDQADAVLERFESLVADGMGRRDAMNLLGSAYQVHWRTISNTLHRLAAIPPRQTSSEEASA